MTKRRQLTCNPLEATSQLNHRNDDLHWPKATVDHSQERAKYT